MSLAGAFGVPASIIRHMLWFRKAESMDADGLKRLQEEKLGAIMAAASKAPAYSGWNLPRSNILGSLADLPTTGRGAVRHDPDSFVPSDRNPASLLHFCTSGSTGTPTKIYLDEAAHTYRHAIRYWTDMSFGRSPLSLYAHIHFVNLEGSNILRHTGLFPKMFLSVFEPDEKNLAALRGRRPSVLRSYPSVLFRLARLNSHSPRPLEFKSAIASAEVLTDAMRREIQSSFSCRLYNHYGSIEASSMARECLFGGMHVDAHSCIIEILGKDGKPKRSGEGEIVVTPLFNTAMPLLRYRIGDRGSWGKCECGSSLPVLKTIGGRSDDRVVLPSGRIRPGMVFQPMADLASVSAFQIVQEAPDLVVFRHVPIGKGIPEAERDEIREGILRACLGEPVRVEFEEVQKIATGRTGKLRMVVSKVPLRI